MASLSRVRGRAQGSNTQRARRQGQWANRIIDIITLQWLIQLRY